MWQQFNIHLSSLPAPEPGDKCQSSELCSPLVPLCLLSMGLTAAVVSCLDWIVHALLNSTTNQVRQFTSSMLLFTEAFLSLGTTQPTIQNSIGSEPTHLKHSGEHQTAAVTTDFLFFGTVNTRESKSRSVLFKTDRFLHLATYTEGSVSSSMTLRQGLVRASNTTAAICNYCKANLTAGHS